MHYSRVFVIFVGEGVNFILAVEVILGLFKLYSIPSLWIHSSSISTMFSTPEANVYGLLWLSSGLANKELWQEIRRKRVRREKILYFPTSLVGLSFVDCVLDGRSSLFSIFLYPHGLLLLGSKCHILSSSS